MASTIFINGQPGDSVSTSDRGLAYGQGVFETILIRSGRALFWEWHMERLEEGCRRLAIPCDGLLQQLENELPELSPDGVLKIVVTRGAGGRGYAVTEPLEPTRIIQLSDLPTWPDNPLQAGIRVRRCRTVLAQQPLLAGIKHLNRLEQVLARAEWADTSIREGLVCDTAGNLIEGTMSNVFFVRDGVLCTPDLSQAGVAGVLRRWVIDMARKNGWPVRVGSFQFDDIESADEVFLCNSIIGIWPVVQFEDVCFTIGERSRTLQSLLEVEYRA
ncbi:MAG: aminodeoxychorismate lyase [Oceanospirillales bacterium]|nr:aminodeoxychorismate lyase [Oceanospirillales bacterium]